MHKILKAVALAGVVLASGCGSGDKPIDPTDFHGHNIPAEFLTRLNDHCGITSAIRPVSKDYNSGGGGTLWQDAAPGGGVRLLWTTLFYSKNIDPVFPDFVWYVTCNASGNIGQDNRNSVRVP